jgi:beta-glucosidase
MSGYPPILKLALALLAALSIAAHASAQVGDIEQRVESILMQMTLEEKIDLLGGVNGFDIRGVPRLGVPQMATADGPFGIRRSSRANVMAGGIILAATWNTALAQTVGREIGRDARARGVHFYLAPGVNIYRSPLNGRNFEYLGEDPWLASRMAVALIEGVQSQGVAATIKHYFGNNSEFARHGSNSVIDERAAREIYLPAFEAAVRQARVGAVMSSYNFVNGERMSASRFFNVDVLKREWGFDGVLMSDWDSTYDTLTAANGGLDLEMPSAKFLNHERLLPLIREGRVSEATLDDKVRRILRTAVRFGWLDREQMDPSIPHYNAVGRQAALQTAREGMVLLKNDGGLLPLSKEKTKRIAIVGPNAYPAVLHGGGSVTVAPFEAVSFLQGLSDHLGTSVEVHYLRGIPDLKQVALGTRFATAAEGGSPGLTVEVFENPDLRGEPAETRIEHVVDLGAPLDFTPLAAGEAPPRPNVPPRPVSMRWTGYYTPSHAGMHDVFVHVGGFSRIFGFRLYVDDRLVADRWDLKTAALNELRLQLDARPHKFVLEHRSESGGFDPGSPFIRMGIVKQGGWVDASVERLARCVDAVIVAAGFDATSELEDWDRSFSLPPGQNDLINAVAAANRNTIVTLTSGGAVDMREWLDRVPAVLQTWYPGQEGGTALAEILFGAVNPSGRLPATFEKRWEDNPAYASYYPRPGSNDVAYKEGVFIGYRGYEKNGVSPQFPFGHGLSYTTFRLSDLSVQRRASSSETLFDVSFTVTNTGDRAGAVVPQLYVAPPRARVPRPPKELKGFTKIHLEPGESRVVTLPLDGRAFAYFDAKARRWRADAGTFGILVGTSSADIELRGKAKLDRTLVL